MKTAGCAWVAENPPMNSGTVHPHACDSRCHRTLAAHVETSASKALIELELILLKTCPQCSCCRLFCATALGLMSACPICRHSCTINPLTHMATSVIASIPTANHPHEEIATSCHLLLSAPTFACCAWLTSGKGTSNMTLLSTRNMRLLPFRATRPQLRPVVLSS